MSFRKRKWQKLYEEGEKNHRKRMKDEFGNEDVARYTNIFHRSPDSEDFVEEPIINKRSWEEEKRFEVVKEKGIEREYKKESIKFSDSLKNTDFDETKYVGASRMSVNEYMKNGRHILKHAKNSSIKQAIKANRGEYYFFVILLSISVPILVGLFSKTINSTTIGFSTIFYLVYGMSYLAVKNVQKNLISSYNLSGLFEEHKVIVDEVGVSSHRHDCIDTLKWEGIKYLIETNQDYLFTTDSGMLIALKKDSIQDKNFMKYCVSQSIKKGKPFQYIDSRR